MRYRRSALLLDGAPREFSALRFGRGLADSLGGILRLVYRHLTAIALPVVCFLGIAVQFLADFLRRPVFRETVITPEETSGSGMSSAGGHDAPSSGGGSSVLSVEFGERLAQMLEPSLERGLQEVS